MDVQAAVGLCAPFEGNGEKTKKKKKNQQQQQQKNKQKKKNNWFFNTTLMYSGRDDLMNVVLSLLLTLVTIARLGGKQNCSRLKLFIVA